MLPAGGPEIPAFLSYNVEKQLSRNKDEFGRGAIEGVAGPEAANNAAFEIFNLQPGPLLFENLPDLVCGL